MLEERRNSALDIAVHTLMSVASAEIVVDLMVCSEAYFSPVVELGLKEAVDLPWTVKDSLDLQNFLVVVVVAVVVVAAVAFAEADTSVVYSVEPFDIEAKVEWSLVLGHQTLKQHFS